SARGAALAQRAGRGRRGGRDRIPREAPARLARSIGNGERRGQLARRRLDMTDKVIITCALTGVLATRKQCPWVPYTPVEIAEEARRAWEAGAAVVHIHARTDEGGPTFEPSVYAAVRRETEARCPVILNWSTGGMGPMEDRVEHIRQTRPSIGALNMGSMNYAK